MSTSVGTNSAGATRAFVGVVAAIFGLTVIDFILGFRIFDELRPVLLADLIVAVSLTVAFLEPTRLRVVALVGASLASVAVSRAVERYGPYHILPVMGTGAWPGFAEVAGLGFLTTWCVRSARLGEVVAALGSLAAAFAAMVVFRQNGNYIHELALLFGAVWLGFAVGGAYLRLLDHRQGELASRARQDERIAIARELHDMVAHHVTGIVVQAQAARLVARHRPEAATQALERIERAGGEALSAMRLMVGTLRDESAPAELAPTASLDDIRAIGDTTGRGELPVRLDIDTAAEALPGEVVASLHRIAREAVTNARRHATGATAIAISVSVDHGHARLLVSNDGAQANRSTGGFGLQGMAERAEALGGEFSAGPVAGGGWQVAAELPVEVTATGVGAT